MVIVTGRVVDNGSSEMSERMKKFPDVFKCATGEELFPGTVNVNVGNPIEVREHFRIKDVKTTEPDQDLLFEICRINDILAYRIRPRHRVTGAGGRGDNILEIACSRKLRENPDFPFDDNNVKISLFR